MKKQTMVILATLLPPLLSACNPRDGIPSDERKKVAVRAKAILPPNASESTICQSIDEASDGGKASLQIALTHSPEGKDFLQRSLSNTNTMKKISFAGSEQANGACWAYGTIPKLAAGLEQASAWRCPVRTVRDNPSKTGSIILEEVYDDQCQFSVFKGIGYTKHYNLSLTRLSF